MPPATGTPLSRSCIRPSLTPKMCLAGGASTLMSADHDRRHRRTDGRERLCRECQGGGIYITDGMVVLRQLVVRNSSDDGTGIQGGGIQVLNGDVTVDRCTIVGNSAGQGGGVYIEDGRLLVKNSILRQNAAYMVAGLRPVSSLIWILNRICSRITPLRTAVGHMQSRDMGM